MGEILFTFLIYLHHRYLHVLFVSHRYLQKCVFMFVLRTKNSSGHVQTNFLLGKVPNILEKFPTFWKSSQLFVSTFFPPPCRRTAWRRYSPFPKVLQAKVVKYCWRAKLEFYFRKIEQTIHLKSICTWSWIVVKWMDSGSQWMLAKRIISTLLLIVWTAFKIFTTHVKKTGERLRHKRRR